MESNLTKIDIRKLTDQLRVVRTKGMLALVLGDCRAVARLTCERARLKDAISLARSMAL